MSGQPLTRARRTLIVDDTPDLRELLALTLDEVDDFEVVAEAGDGRAGVEQAQRERPDLVVLDLAMPVMDGLEALPYLRRACPDATIVVLSGFGASAMRDEALVSGADGYVEKGTRLPAIVDRLRRIAQESESRRGGADREAVDLDAGTAPAWTPRSPVAAGPDPAALLVEHAPVAMLVADPRDGSVVAANGAAAQLLGISAGPLASLADELPELWSALLGSAERMDHDRNDLRITVVRDSARIAVRARRLPDQVLVYAGPDPADEEVVRLRGAITTTAHELRAPVTVLTGIAEALDRSERLEPARRAALLASVGRQARRLEALTADLLTAALARRGVLEVRLQEVDLRDAVQTILEAHPDVALHVLGRDGDPSARLRVRADLGRLEQMVTNLLTNARKHGAPPLLATLSARGPWVHLEVEDRGPGVPEPFRDQLFDEYARAPGTTAPGTGLGLFVVRRLALAHGGEVRHRNGADRGAVFTLSLPAVGQAG